MAVYRLDPNPIKLSDPAWALSAINEAVWAEAPTPDAARRLAAGKTARAVPAVWHQTKPRSPWLNPDLTFCVYDTSKADIAPGTVLSLQGAVIGE